MKHIKITSTQPLQSPSRENGVNEELIPMWQLVKIQNALRLTNNIYECHKKVTAYDRVVVEALEFCNEATRNNTNKEEK